MALKARSIRNSSGIAYLPVVSDHPATGRYRFLFSLLLEHKGAYLPGALLIWLTLWMTLSIPQLLDEAVEILRNHPDPASAGFQSRIYWIVAFAVAIMMTRTASRLLFFTPGRRVEYDLKNRLLAHLTTLQRDYFLANPTGAIISRVNNDINGVRMLMGFGLLQLANSVTLLSMAPLRMYAISPRLTLYVVLPILLAFVVQQFAIRRLRALQQVQMRALQDISDFAVESYNGLEVLRAYRAMDWAEHRFDDHSERIRANAYRMAAVRGWFMPVLAHTVNLLKVVLVMAGGLLVIESDMTIGEFMAYLLYLSMLLPPLMGMSFMLFVLQRGMTALSSLETVFHTRPVLPPVDPQAEARLPSQLRQGLRVCGLSYAYPDAPDRPVLQDVSFAIGPSEIVGVFGTIGCGKTTLVNLVNRYLQPPAGSVSLDGVDIAAISHQRLRRHVVTVGQEPFLFSATIRDNVRFAAPEVDDETVRQALDSAAMRDDLARFPAGLDTLAGEKGINLSGGQKQRIALARALLRPCDLLILDEVLSAVDHETERYLIRRIYDFRQARSLLIVSHRISALERADRIVVLDAGRVADIGPHAELIRRDGLYRRAWLLQKD